MASAKESAAEEAALSWFAKLGFATARTGTYKKQTDQYGRGR